jgi:hypothetical protein
MRWLGAAALLVFLASPAFAGSTTVTGKDAGGVTRTFDVITDGSGNYVWEHGVCDGTAAAQCSAVKAASTAAAQTDPALVTRNPDLGTISDTAFTGSGNATVIAALKGVYAGVTTPGAGAATTVNHAVTVTTGLTFQTILATGTRKSLTIQNNQISGTDVCYLVFGTNIDSQIVPGTTTTSTNFTIGGNTVQAGMAALILNPGQPFTRYYPLVPSDAIYATCSTTGDSIYVDAQ